MWLAATILNSTDLIPGLGLGERIFASLFKVNFQKKSIQRNSRLDGLIIVGTSTYIVTLSAFPFFHKCVFCGKKKKGEKKCLHFLVKYIL